ncbi:MAG TPA: LytTR family DNA-binding domain-containing protein [Aliidongia sp.]|uniref:LytTR family DNA-binding domain-containing protein n=1 Tax=Aliidongia sp. TaxID=1914230 RepID=UPI002DDD1DEA|nr:LytTR family DNA-binding domain-containing protein [Aliidongia sp.]HEV2676207.1 LytTR family DNA-binding domain-containing protein [Aliidongia sp.]
MRRFDLRPVWRRAAAELALLGIAGLFMGVIGPYGTDAIPADIRFVYWVLCIVGGGAIGVVIDGMLTSRTRSFWLRLALSSLLMSPLVTLFVMMVGDLVAKEWVRSPGFFGLLWQVFVVSVAVMAFRALTWRMPRTVIETRTVVALPLPEAEAAFRSRLSARRRAARLIAVEAYDHYLRVHTDAGSELVTLRFADALAELAGAHGFRTHRSWWIAADAIETVRWRRGVGEAGLAGGLVAPVSRTHAPALKAAGWF